MTLRDPYDRSPSHVHTTFGNVSGWSGFVGGFYEKPKLEVCLRCCHEAFSTLKPIVGTVLTDPTLSESVASTFLYPRQRETGSNVQSVHKDTNVVSKCFRRALHRPSSFGESTLARFSSSLRSSNLKSTKPRNPPEPKPCCSNSQVASFDSSIP